jgi:hypothetical protein
MSCLSGKPPVYFDIPTQEMNSTLAGSLSYLRSAQKDSPCLAQSRGKQRGRVVRRRAEVMGWRSMMTLYDQRAQDTKLSMLKISLSYKRLRVRTITHRKHPLEITHWKRLEILG